MKFELIAKGKSALGKDIPVFQTGVNKKSYIYIMAGTHGDEPEGIYVLDKLFSWLQEDEIHFIPTVVIPILNPDGLELKTRTNGNKVDLNRNYKTKNWQPSSEKERYFPGPHPMSEPENIFLEELFKTYPPSFILSFHAWKPLIDYDGEALEIANFLSKFNQYPVTDYIGYPTPGSFGTYIQENFKVPVITFECPESSPEKSFEDIWLENEKGLKALFTDKILRKFY